MDRTLNNSLYEQILYVSILQIMELKNIDIEDKIVRARALGETFGRKAIIVYAKNLPHNAFSTTEKILQLISAELWNFIFGNYTTDVTSPTLSSISFKDNNMILMKRLDAPAELREQKEDMLALLKSFMSGIISGILLYFKTECEVKIIFQNESLFVHIACE